jgi:N-acetylmuramate 1-kinase
MKFSKDYKKIKGDASFRKFFKNKKKKSILVFANKEKNKNLLIYDAINKILIKNGVIAPKLLSQNYRKNYIEIEDLGDKTIYQTFVDDGKNHYLIFKKVIKILNNIQLIKKKKLKISKTNFIKLNIIKKIFY